MSDEVDLIRAGWARLGAGLAGRMAPATPDVEHLVVDTARWSRSSAQVVTAAVTWLSRHAGLVAEHRLETLVRRGGLEEHDLPRLGLLLDLSATLGRQHDRRRNLRRAMRLCRPAGDPRPCYDVARTGSAMAQRAERRASTVSRRWNLRMDPVEPKLDALRPRRWIIETNPSLAIRADFRGDLRASLVLCLEEAGEERLTVSRLAGRTGASRLATIHALEDLELGGHVVCDRIARVRSYRRRKSR